MKTIQTKPGVTLGFLEWDKGKSTKGLLILHNNELFERKPIGQLSEITEEQAKELVESIWFENYKWYGQFHHPMQNSVTTKAILSLKSAAESLGIPESEFNNYLVVKLYETPFNI